MTIVHAPWGSHEVLAEGENWKVKRIVVSAGARLSLQRHQLRDETWTVIAGAAEIEMHGAPRMRYEGPTWVQRNTWHRLTNPGLVPLEIIEVQYGVCREDDIERKEDDYGRATPCNGSEFS